MIWAELKTGRLTLRRFTAADLEPFARINADTEVMRFFPAPMSRAESDALAARIDAGFEERGYGLWAVERNGTGEFLGFAGLSVPRFEAHFTPAVEIGWRLARRAWGHGYATEAAGSALALAFRELGLDEVVSFTSAGNFRSRAVMARLGMTHCPREGFLHPMIPASHPLAAHVLYRISSTGWRARG